MNSLRNIGHKLLEDDSGNESSKRVTLFTFLALVIVYSAIGVWCCVFHPLKDAGTFIKLFDGILVALSAVAGFTVAEKFKSKFKRG